MRLRSRNALVASPLSLLVYAAFTVSGSPTVDVSLRTAWSAPPLLPEFLESIALESPSAFFPLLDALSEPGKLPAKLTPEATYSLVLQTALESGLLSSPGAEAAVRLNLALHAAAPRVSAAFQHYPGSPCPNVHGEAHAAWVDWYGEAACDLDSLLRFVSHETLDPAHPDFNATNATETPPRPRTLANDNIFPPLHASISRPERTAVLYGAPGAPGFRELHSTLLGLARAPRPRVEYVFRHLPPAPLSEASKARAMYLSGYGVVLDLKKMDYLALDDRQTNSRAAKADDNAETDSEHPLASDPILDLLSTYPEPETGAANTSTPLTEDELLFIGMQLAQLVLQSDTPLTALKQLAQNFPRYATTVARRAGPPALELVEEIQTNLARVPAGMSIAWLNGLILPEADMSPLPLIRHLRKERAIIRELTALGLKAGEAVALITHPAIASAQNDAGVVDGLVDASDRPEGGGAVIWLNDLTKDSRYQQWPKTLSTLMRPLYPGQIHGVALNIYNAVLALDLSKPSSLGMLLSMRNIIMRDFALRFGVVPIVETEDGAKMAKLFYHLVDRYGRSKTFEILGKLVNARGSDLRMDWEIVGAEFAALRDMKLSAQDLAAAETALEDEGETDEFAAVTLPMFDEIMDGDDEVLAKARAYAKRLDIKSSTGPMGHGFVNGRHFAIDDQFWSSMQGEVARQLQFLQEKLHFNKLSDDDVDAISTYFFDLPTTSLRRNSLVYPATPEDLHIVSLPDLFRQSGATGLFPGSFIYPSPDLVHVPVTIHVVADLDSEDGLSLIREALLYMDSEAKSRLSFIHNPAEPDSAPQAVAEAEGEPHRLASSLVSHLLRSNALHDIHPSHLLRALGLDPAPVSDADAAQAVLSQQDVLDEITGGFSLQDIDRQAYDAYVQTSRLVAHHLGLAPGEHALVVNGRIIGPIEVDDIQAPDFKALEMFELRKRVQPVVTAFQSVIPEFIGFDRAVAGDMVAVASSIVSSIIQPDPSETGLFQAPPKFRTRNYLQLAGNHTRFEIGDKSTALYQVAVVLDPLSEAAQKWTSILEWLLTIPDVHVTVQLNPPTYKEMPIKRFYRYNIIPELAFDEQGEEIQPRALFNDLPVQPIYTLGMDVPPSWLVRPREALHDLDNIQLGRMGPDELVSALFDLDYLVVEGHARDRFTNQPPRGLQVQLTDGSGAPVDDTQVVANLGYLQFRATPGVYHLEIRPGRGRELFTMESVGNDGWESPTVEKVGNEVTLMSFEGLTLYPRLARIPGQPIYDVLADPSEFEDEDSSGGVLTELKSRISSLMGSWFYSETEVKEEPTTSDIIEIAPQADINIFTVASGLLYERFLSIMVLSVLRNTNSTVKFWFIENFLSPSFLEFIPHFAKEYNFQYELVTYKWPSWLRAQTEKQRVIWAYKILFLDVLFPMDLKKVIFVDADQIVRADLKELVDLDLHGAPYGYTPMGDDNAEMEGFRFWKTGYWKDYLRGLPYHISALYVIDLVRFRKLAAGDMLRGQYQALSGDPNSLANLDQDLPNNLQREVPIFSLPEDWLWCETWCSKDRLDRAKTIDLCQNPLTKEPKLERARKIPEWEEYDAEVARLSRRLADEGVVRSMTSADVNALAGSAKTPGEAITEDVPLELEQENVGHERDEL